MTRAPETIPPVRSARSAGNAFVQTRTFEVLARAGFVARGLVYGIIGVLAFELAIGHGGKITNQQGAMRTLEHQPLGHLLLIALALGLGGYAMWRLFRAILGHGPQGADRGIERLGALGSGIVYATFCAIAVTLLTGSSSGNSSGNAKKTTHDVFAWPAGHWIVGIAGLVMIGVGVYQLIRGVRHKFLDDSKTEQMSPVVKKWITWFGTIGHVARAIVFGLVGTFLLKAAIDYKANEAIGLNGALAKLYDRPYGPEFLGVVAAGLVVFGIFSLTEARYRRI
jgi:succinate dehydrogenase/fumarate reductase cytochrome b subunit